VSGPTRPTRVPGLRIVGSGAPTDAPVEPEQKIVDRRPHGRSAGARPALEDFDPALPIHAGLGGVHRFITWDTQEWTQEGDSQTYRADADTRARALQLAPTASVFLCARRLLHTDQTRILHWTVIPFNTAFANPGLTENPFRPPAEVYQDLARAGHDLWWRDTVHVADGSRAEASILNLLHGVPILVHTRVTLDATGLPLLLEETRLPADTASIRIHHPE
jgi:hypothetical protein